MEKEMIETLSEAFADGENIAKSAIRLAIDRSLDLGMNPVMTLTIVKALCELAISDHKEKFRKRHPLGKLEEEFDIFTELDKMVTHIIKEGFERSKAKHTGA